MSTPKDTLRQFLSYSILDSAPVFEKFKELDGADYRESGPDGKQRFLFVEGKREDRVVLVAHADTYFDRDYYPGYLFYEPREQIVEERDGYFVGRTVDGQDSNGLGADDRAGCALLWELRDSGHSLLITDGEEHGQVGSYWLMKENPDIADKINAHQFMIQFDRRRKSDYKCYNVGTDAFRAYVEEKTGFTEPDRLASTDIRVLCRGICGVNLSVGYYGEHTNEERIRIEEWERTLGIAKKWLGEGRLERFVLLIQKNK